MIRFVYIICALQLISACNESSNDTLAPNVISTPSEQERIERYAEEFNQTIIQEDSVMIYNYLNQRDWDIQETGTGIYYYIFNTNDSLKPKAGDHVTIEYLISSLEGDTLYSSDLDGVSSFNVDKEDLESGVHEAVKLLGIGDEGVFIMVNNRAHGVLGDESQIQPYQVLLYKLKLIAIE